MTCEPARKCRELRDPRVNRPQQRGADPRRSTSAYRTIRTRRCAQRGDVLEDLPPRHHVGSAGGDLARSVAERRIDHDVREVALVDRIGTRAPVADIERGSRGAPSATARRNAEKNPVARTTQPSIARIAATTRSCAAT